MKYVLMGLIRLYQWTVSPLLGPVCRYHPSCSHYGYQAIRAHGAAKGTLLTAWRVLRCNPWSRGGYDPPPPPGRWRAVAEPAMDTDLDHADHDHGAAPGEASAEAADAAEPNEGSTSSTRVSAIRARRARRALNRRGTPTTVQGA